MRLILSLCVCHLALLCGGGPAVAGLVPEAVLLVVNGDSQSSLAVANEYVHLRQIPDANIVTLTGLTSVEQMSVDAFRQQILSPVLAAIEQRGLRSQIKCVVYSTDFPTAIDVKSDAGGKTLPQVLTPIASINGLTFLHQLTMAKDTRYLDLNVNTYARRFGPRSSDTPWQDEELKQYAAAVQRLQLNARRRPSTIGLPADAMQPANDPALLAAIESLHTLRKSHPHSAELLYNMACSLANADRPGDALQTLKEAVAAGWFDHRHAARDPDFSSIADRNEFKSLLEAMKSAKLEVQPAVGFRSDMGWLPNGETSTQNDQPHFLLSTVLGVTSGRGTNVPEVIANLRRSAAADGTRPAGTVYYVRNGDVRSTTREWGFASAVAKLKDLGVEAVIEEGVLPLKRERVAGAMIGIADFDWPKSESTILPGAIVEHLTSFGGVMTSGAGQTPLTEFLRHGAAGSSGTVTEPYAIQAKFPNPFIHVHYANGTSLAEAFYLSVTGPYQLLIVGDPLCNPWQRELKFTCDTPPSVQPWQGTVQLVPKSDSNVVPAVTSFTLFVDGDRKASGSAGTPFEFDTTTLTDGEHQLALVGYGNDPIESSGRLISRFSVRNDQTKPLATLTSRSGQNIPFDQPLEIEASSPGATELTIHHLGREVATIKGESGTVAIQPVILGPGPVTLQLVAKHSSTAQAGPRLTVTLEGSGRDQSKK